MNVISWKTTLLIFMCIILTACQTPRPRPTKPTLIIQPNNGGICLDKENAVKLGTYILELENSHD